MPAEERAVHRTKSFSALFLIHVKDYSSRIHQKIQRFHVYFISFKQLNFLEFRAFLAFLLLFFSISTLSNPSLEWHGWLLFSCTRMCGWLLERGRSIMGIPSRTRELRHPNVNHNIYKWMEMRSSKDQEKKGTNCVN